MSDTAKCVANAYGCRDSACMFGGGAAGHDGKGRGYAYSIRSVRQR